VTREVSVQVDAEAEGTSYDANVGTRNGHFSLTAT